jgi:hypothetical protein
MENDHPNEDESAEPHWCVDCECELPAAEQQRSWVFCDFCGQAVCATCDRTHTCADMLRKKPRHW